MPTAKKTKEKAKPKPKLKPKPKAKAPVKAKPAPKAAVKAPSTAKFEAALAELKNATDIKIASIEEKLAKAGNADKLKQLEDKLDSHIQKTSQEMAKWEHMVDRKLDLLHDTMRGLAEKIAALESKGDALEQAVSSTPPDIPPESSY